MVCDHCGLVWDRDDDDPPECKLIDNVIVIENNATSVVIPVKHNDDKPGDHNSGDHDEEMRKIKGMLDNENT